MPINHDRLCPCHALPMRKNGRAHYCVVKRQASQRRYRQSAKRKESNRRYDTSEKGRATRRRYDDSATGRANNLKRAARRLFFGSEYREMADTVEQADQLNAFIRRRMGEFKQTQRDERERAEANGEFEGAAANGEFELRIVLNTAEGLTHES